jgi:hypothetical protein
MQRVMESFKGDEILENLLWLSFSTPNLTIPIDDKFSGGQFFQTHRTEGVELRGADPDLRT